MIQGAVLALPSQRRNTSTIKRSDPKPYRRNSAAAAPVSRHQGEEDDSRVSYELRRLIFILSL